MSTVKQDASTGAAAPAPFSPAWYDQPRPTSRYDRVVGAGFNTVVGALMATVGWRA